MSKDKIFCLADIAKHNKRESAYVSFHGKVYDVTNFMPDHPGGDDIMMDYIGKDVGQIMGDESQHVHSKSAYEMMEEYRIGELGGDEKTVSEDWVATDDFKPEETDTVADYNRNKFLDLNQPLMNQVWHANWSKDYYLSQIHNPRHVKGSAKMFASPILDNLTKTEWYVIPLIWGPVTLFYAVLSLLQHTDSQMSAQYLLQYPLPALPVPTVTAFARFIACYIPGCIFWTFMEYFMHRFVFHVDELLPDNPYALVTHFLVHGVHHYLPMDRLRLVMPPLLFLTLSTPFVKLAHVLFVPAVANGVVSGAFTFYILYDMTHYALHHTRLPAYLAEMKRYHLAHHYKNFELGFGVTSKLWDYIFSTVLPVATK